MSKGHSVSPRTHTKSQMNHYANQHNPNNPAYKAARDNHANQCNPNNPEYRGYQKHKKRRLAACPKNRNYRTPRGRNPVVVRVPTPAPAPTQSESGWGTFMTGVAVAAVGILLYENS